MNTTEALDSTTCFMVDDDILNFSLEEEKHPSISSSSFSSLDSSNNISFLPDDRSRSFHESVEEELEWLSNKDAFPAVEFDIFSENMSNVIFDHHSPVSVLENGSSISTNNNSCNINDKENAFMIGCSSLHVPVNYPVRARGKRRRRISFADLTNERCVWGRKMKFKNNKQEWGLLSLPMTKAKRASIGRRCQHCGVDKTPQWRAGPMGPKTLCNACGVRYKSGRLLPEYRPANSPTFSADLHSNSHRKVMEMRKQRTGNIGGLLHEVC